MVLKWREVLNGRVLNHSVYCCELMVNVAWGAVAVLLVYLNIKHVKAAFKTVLDHVEYIHMCIRLSTASNVFFMIS